MPARYRRRTLLNYLFARRANSFTPSFLHRSASTGSKSTAKAARSRRTARYRTPSPRSESPSASTPPSPRSRRARVPPLERRNTARSPDPPRHHAGRQALQLWDVRRHQRGRRPKSRPRARDRDRAPAILRDRDLARADRPDHKQAPLAQPPRRSGRGPRVRAVPQNLERERRARARQKQTPVV